MTVDDAASDYRPWYPLLERLIKPTREPWIAGTPPVSEPFDGSKISIGAAWSTDFKHPLDRRIFFRLRHSYRAPDFFVARMVRGKSHVGFVTFDEGFTLDRLSGTTAQIQEEVEIMYLSTHGSCTSGLYCAHLYANDWIPTQHGLGKTGPAIIVFDTCDLIDPNDPSWTNHWKGNNVGPALRLVLGFAGPADSGKKPSRRGDGFAREMLRGKPVAKGWLTAVHQTSISHQDNDHGIAIALGDSPSDAQHVLDNVTLGNWPGPRIGSKIEIAWKFCH